MRVKKQDHAEAVEASLGVWQGNDRARGEGQDSDHAIAFRGVEVPELDAFAHWARRIYAPLAAAVTAGPRG
jgi:hypothetical protein